VRNRRRLVADHDETREIWPSFTDVMSTMALILFVLVLLAYVHNLVSSKRLEALERQISASEQQLHTLRDEIRAGRASLASSQAKLHDQEGVLSDTNRQLDELRDQLQGIAVLRVSVLNKLKQAIEAQLGATNPRGADLVTIGDNGNVVVNESLVFESNSYAIKPEARPTLDALARALGSVLADADTRANIDTILVQGHTDERGTASFNWDLSAKRATAVLDYLFQANKTLADSFGSYFAASAYSKFRPLNPGKTEEAYQQNRRIEISVVAKDDNVRKVIDDYMQRAVPAPSHPSPGIQ
jgi:chemotaxis protein MotB